MVRNVGFGPGTLKLHSDTLPLNIVTFIDRAAPGSIPPTYSLGTEYRVFSDCRQNSD